MERHAINAKLQENPTHQFSEWFAPQSNQALLPPVYKDDYEAPSGSAAVARCHTLLSSPLTWDSGFELLALLTQMHYHQDLELPTISQSYRRLMAVYYVRCQSRIWNQWTTRAALLPTVAMLAGVIIPSLLSHDAYLLRVFLVQLLAHPPTTWTKRLLTTMRKQLQDLSTVTFNHSSDSPTATEQQYVEMRDNSMWFRVAFHTVDEPQSQRSELSYDSLMAHPWWKEQLQGFIERELRDSSIRWNENGMSTLHTCSGDHHVRIDSKNTLAEVAKVVKNDNWLDCCYPRNSFFEWSIEEVIDNLYSSELLEDISGPPDDIVIKIADFASYPMLCMIANAIPHIGARCYLVEGWVRVQEELFEKDPSLFTAERRFGFEAAQKTSRELFAAMELPEVKRADDEIIYEYASWMRKESFHDDDSFDGHVRLEDIPEHPSHPSWKCFIGHIDVPNVSVKRQRDEEALPAPSVRVKTEPVEEQSVME